MATPNLATINERLNAMINEMARFQRALQAEIDAQAAPEMVSLPADEVAELREKAAAKPAPAPAATATTDKK